MSLGKLSIAISLLVAVAVFGCGSDRPDDAVATVENNWLSLDDLRYPEDVETSEAVERWIDNQVLLYHARGMKLPGYPIRDAAELFAQRLRARVFLDSLVRARIKISDSLVTDYYSRNPGLFVTDAASAHIVHIGFFKEAEAIEAKTQLSPVTSSDDSLWSDYNLDEKWVVAGRLHPQLEQQIFSAPLHRLVGPVTSDFGFHLIFIQQRFNAGDQIPFTWVKDNIYRRLLLQRWPGIEAEVLDSLREETNFEIISE